MGLLDQVLGQVIGNMGGGRGRVPDAGGGGPGGGLGDILGQVLGGGAPQRQGPSAPAPGGGTAPGGGASSGGGLGDLLAGAGGKYSPLILAVLAILANKHMASGAGGIGSILHDMFSGGGGRSQGGGGPQGGSSGPEETVGGPEGYEDGPDGYAEGTDDGYGRPSSGMDGPFGGPSRGGAASGGGRAGGGGFLNDVGSMLDGPGGAGPQGGRAGQGGGAFGGFDDLQRRFEENGRGDLMGSWVGSGANREPSPVDLEQALGAGTIDQLSQRFGIERGELLQGLSRALPQVVDGLTPDGRPPTADEQSRWV